MKKKIEGTHVHLETPVNSDILAIAFLSFEKHSRTRSYPAKEVPWKHQVKNIAPSPILSLHRQPRLDESSTEMQSSLVTLFPRFPFPAWFSCLIRDQVTMTTVHSGRSFSVCVCGVLCIILKINLLSVWCWLPFLTNFLLFLDSAQCILKEMLHFRGFADTTVASY